MPRHPMRSLALLPAFAAFAFALSFGLVSLSAQKHHDTLTEAQVDKIREAGIDPNERIKLYTQFVSEHVNAVKVLTNRAKSDARASRLDRELQDCANLMDELGANLDQYSERHADMRPALKSLADESQHWLVTLRALSGEGPFDLSRKEAIEAGQDIADESQRLLREQSEYFAAHKDEKGQERAEPKPQ